LLVGPWLGLERERASELGERLGVPVGEALAATAASVGIRFEAARAALLAREGVEVVAGRVARIEPRGARFAALCVERPPVEADAVVLAVGGLAGGGVIYDPPEHAAGPEGAERVRPPFRLSLEVEGVTLGTDGARRLAGSMFGPDLERSAWPRPGEAGTLERVGVVARRTELGPGLYAAGDVLAGSQRTVLAALRSGIAAGHRAARSVVES
jgi:glycerol-3-phosphate dehydrogenase subunit B